MDALNLALDKVGFYFLPGGIAESAGRIQAEYKKRIRLLRHPATKFLGVITFRIEPKK